MDITGFKSHHFTIIGQNTIITGNLNLQDQAQIWGEIHGDILTTEKIYIERTSLITGDIRCHDIVISGKVSGKITSKGQVTLRSSAIIEGSIESEQLIINPGAKLDATLETYK